MQSIARPLQLSISSASEANTKALNEYLQSLTETECEAAKILVELKGKDRTEFLDQARLLYNTALQNYPDVRVDVIPVVAVGPSGPVYVDKQFLEADAGFSPFYSYVAVGGTFDHLHSGHKLLLTTAVLHATEKLRVGVTGKALLTKKKFANAIQPIDTRKSAVHAFLREIRKDVELEIDVIADVSGGTDTIADVKAIVLSPETQSSLPIINDLRAKNSLAPLEPVLIPFVQSSSGIISSTKIRERIQ